MDKPGNEPVLMIENLQRIERRPGDVFVITSDRHLNTAHCERILAAWKMAMGDAKCVILDGGLKLGVINPEALASEEVR